MPALRGAKIFRSGVTAPKWNFESETATIDSSTDSPSINFKFELASKGGGTTEVSFQIAPIGFDAVLNQMYKAAPDRVAKLMARQMNGHFWPE
jgi:hypothetical protein